MLRDTQFRWLVRLSQNLMPSQMGLPVPAALPKSELAADYLVGIQGVLPCCCAPPCCMRSRPRRRPIAASCWRRTRPLPACPAQVLPCAIVRGALAGLGHEAAVTADATSLPQVDFTVVLRQPAQR